MIGIRHVKLVVCVVLTTACSLVTAYYHAFTSLASYDDEGLMMIMVKYFLAGNSVYDRLHSIYGPAYYWYESSALHLMRAPLSNDSVRFVSIFFWVVAAVFVLLLVYRLTRSLTLAVAGHFLSFQILSFIGEEPAHPQELCIVLLVCVALAASYTRRRRLMMALLGIVAATLFATKINLGAYVTAALAIVFALAARPRWIRRFASIPVTAAVFLLPLVLMESRLAETWVFRYCALVMVALAATLWVLVHNESDVRLMPGDYAAWLVCFVSVLAVFLGFALAHGSSIAGMFESLVVFPRLVMRYWFIRAPMKELVLPWMIVGLACAWYAVSGRCHPAILNAGKLSYSVIVILWCAEGYYGRVMNFAPPLLWLVAVCPSQADSGEGQRFTRNTLALLGVLQMLYAYPVAGSQVAFTTVLPMVAALVCLSDFLLYFSSLRRQWMTPALSRRGLIVATLLICGFYLNSAWNARLTYKSFVPLDLPGAKLIHLEPERVTTLRNLVANVPVSCTMLLTAPNMFSLNFWTGKPAPYYLPLGAWILGTATYDQEDVIGQMSRDAQPCVVFNQELIDFWTHGRDISTQPLVRYIHDRYHTIFELSGYRIMAPN